MTNYTLTAAATSFAITPRVVGDGRPGTLLKHRTAAEQAFEEARFARWSENNTNGLTVTYRNYLRTAPIDPHPDTE